MTNVSGKAMLCTVRAGSYGGETIDRSLTAALAKETGGDERAFKGVKLKLPKGAMDPVKAAIGRVRKTWQKFTSPWLYDGTGILPSENYFSFMEQHREDVRGMKKAVDGVCAMLPVWATSESIRLGTAFNEREFPTEAEIREACWVECIVTPLSLDSDDFRLNLIDEEIEEIKAAHEETIKRQLGRTLASSFKRLVPVLKNVAEGLERYGQKTGKRASTFHEQTISRAGEMADLVDSLNIMGDEDLRQLAADIRKEISIYDASYLKENDYARAQVADKARDLLKRAEEGANVSDFFGLGSN